MTQKLPGGYNGKILRVNLSNKSISTETLDAQFCRRYIGGAGFVAYFLWKELPHKIDALSPENKLVFALGPVSGLNLPGAARNCVGAKSPQSGGIAKSEAGGLWGAELKRAGYDVVIIEGKAEKPVYLWIHDGEASLRDASKIWGEKTKETQLAIRADLGDDKVQVSQIGPAGENLVCYSCIMNGLFDVAGRGGLGAVMGSKNLKAVAVRGHKLPKIANPEAFKELRHNILEHLYDSEMSSWLRDTGTGGAEIEFFEASGNLPVRNFRDGLFPEVKQIHAGIMKETMWDGKDGCYACPLRCKKRVKLEEPYKIDPDYGGPEYETIAALGSNCGITHPETIAKGNELCNAYSLDTISIGSVIAFAMECFEKGLLTTEDTGGIELKFGNDEALVKSIELIAKREGVGKLLAEGTALMSQKIGHGSEAFAMHVKGVDAGMHEPRNKAGFGLAFMINPNGADHALAMQDIMYESDEGIEPIKYIGMIDPLPATDMSPRKVALFKNVHSISLVSDCLVTCLMVPLSYRQLADITAAVTGWDTGVMEQLRVAERVFTTARLFNVNQGLTAKDDKLPLRYFQPKTDGVLSDTALDPEEMEKGKQYYYNVMGWDAEGVPLSEKVEELGIQ